MRSDFVHVVGRWPPTRTSAFCFVAAADSPTAPLNPLLLVTPSLPPLGSPKDPPRGDQGVRSGGCALTRPGPPVRD